MEHIYHDAMGFGFRAASWLDLVKRTKDFAALHYACIDARLAIEHLIFEQIIITKGEEFTAEEYERCLSEPRKLEKLLNKISPDYEKLQAFTEVIGSLSPGAPPINQWNPKELMKSWGRLSAYLHWSGAYSETTENKDWQVDAIRKVAEIIEPFWEKMSSAQSGCFRPESMEPSLHQVWEDFRRGIIDREAARIRMELLRPIPHRGHT